LNAVSQFAITGFITGAINSGTLKGGLIGAFTGALSAGIPGLGEIGDFLAQSSIAGLGSVLSGGKFGHGFASAGITRLAAPGLTGIKSDVGRAAASALIGGSVSKLTGGKFANGAVTGAMQSALSSLASGRGGLASDSEVDQVFIDNGIDPADIAEQAAFNPDTALAFDLPSLPQGLVNGVTGFGDGVFQAITFGLGDLQDVRNSLSIDAASVDFDSRLFNGARLAGNIQGGVALGGAGATRLLSSSREGLRAACLAASLCTTQATAAGNIVLKPTRAVIQAQVRFQEIRIGVIREQANRFRKVIRDL
ncbi:MAG: hypothetical protein U1C04_21860, partial [Hydrogenophaga sp.]|nr:hypothetical protein [Hydrogenophaga sp.]